MKLLHLSIRLKRSMVAPYVGAWIETKGNMSYVPKVLPSHPTWVRGLKPKVKHFAKCLLGRTLRGCVD